MARIIKSSEPEANGFARYERNVLPEQTQEMFLEESEGEASVTLEMDVASILARANEEADGIREAAHQEGVQQGLAAAALQFEETVSGILNVLQAVSGELRQARETFLSSLEPQVLQLVSAITSRILRREAETDFNVVRGTVRAALEHLVERERVVIRINPKDFTEMRERNIDLAAHVDGVSDLVVSPDEKVAPGGCMVETATMTVDARLEEQLRRIFDTMSG
ncbi:MAG: FliH/SctL family protein [Candidatus Hydrogenedentales bacterium]